MASICSNILFGGTFRRHAPFSSRESSKSAEPIASQVVADIDHNYRHVVLKPRVGADPAAQVGDDLIDELLRRDGGATNQKLLEAYLAKELVAGVVGFDEPIGEEEQAVACVQLHFGGGVPCIDVEREQEPALVEALHAAVSPTQQRRRVSSARVAEPAVERVDHPAARGHICARESAAKRAIDVRERHAG